MANDAAQQSAEADFDSPMHCGSSIDSPRGRGNSGERLSDSFGRRSPRLAATPGHAPEPQALDANGLPLWAVNSMDKDANGLPLWAVNSMDKDTPTRDQAHRESTATRLLALLLPPCRATVMPKAHDVARRAASGDVHVVIDLFDVHEIALQMDSLHLMDSHKTHKLRAPDDAPEGTLGEWFDALVVKLDELRTAPRPDREADLTEASGRRVEEEALHLDHHPAWYRLRGGRLSMAFGVITMPLKAAIHLTVPDVNTPKWAKYYTLTLLLSVVWLAVLAYAMTLILEEIGCALNISSTVMGLTWGAIGTSFPNLCVAAKATPGALTFSQATPPLLTRCSPAR